MSTIKRLFITAMLLMIFTTNYSQEVIRKEVKVVQPYAPKLFDAYKINLLPRLNDTLQLTTDFDYRISPKAYSSEYDIRKIKAARLLDEPLPKLYGSYLELGLGNYLTPLAELSISKKRSEKYSFGVYARHLSSNYKVKNQNDKKTFAGYRNDEFDLYGKRIWKKSVLSGSAGLDSRAVYYYGYNTSAVDTTLEKDSIKQNFTNLNARIAYRSINDGSDLFNYDFRVNYDYFSDKFKFIENKIVSGGKLSLLYNELLFGLDLDYIYIEKGDKIEKEKNNIVKISPWFKKETDEWRLKAGLNTALEINNSNLSAHLYPDAMLKINVADDLVDSYFGVSGNLEVNDYHKIAWENPYIKSGFQVRNSNNKLNIYGGLTGHISTSLSYKVRVSYKMIDDMYFYVNDTSDILGNKFYTEYDDVRLTLFYGEISVRPFDNFSMFINGNYYKYSMTNQTRPWHKPEWDLTVSTRYNLRDKILINFDVYGSGKRYAKSYGESGVEEAVLDGIMDIKFGVEYRYTKILSAYMKVYNLTSSKYQKWNQYPVQGLMIMGGITYSL